jgi:hypothetical protein
MMRGRIFLLVFSYQSSHALGKIDEAYGSRAG